jgi:hypothetical protein
MVKLIQIITVNTEGGIKILALDDDGGLWIGDSCNVIGEDIMWKKINTPNKDNIHD